jgi:hypothetical protein
MKVLFIFMDGVGLGDDDPDKNPFAAASMPNLRGILDGARLVADAPPVETERASLTAIDACLEVKKNPQSATGQATILTGRNIPKRIGYHYGPKPNEAVAAEIHAGTIFHELQKRGQRSVLLNAYPAGYFEAIESGRRLYSAIPLGVTSAGLELMTTQDLVDGRALSADFTGDGWREHLNISDAPVYTTHEAGRKLNELTEFYEFTFFEYWISDMVGHRQDMAGALNVLSKFDEVLGGLLEVWDDDRGLILITSDHGNLENLDTRKHTKNLVPFLLIGSQALRNQFGKKVNNLAEIAPAILQFLE